MIHDLTLEAMFSLVEQDNRQAGSPAFLCHPDPTLPAIIFNNQDELFQDKRVRWALALMLDARQISMASYRGAATLSAIAIPPTGTHLDDYQSALQDWLINYELDTGSSTIRPYDPDIGLQVAEMVRPQFIDAVPTDLNRSAAPSAMVGEAGPSGGCRAAKTQVHPSGQRLVQARWRALRFHAQDRRKRRDQSLAPWLHSSGARPALPSPQKSIRSSSERR